MLGGRFGPDPERWCHEESIDLPHFPLARFLLGINPPWGIIPETTNRQLSELGVGDT